MVALSKLLSPQVLTRVISREAGATDWLLNLFGCGAGGSSELNMGHGRNGKYHIFNNVRTVAKGTAPGMPANRRSANPMSAVPFVYPRMHDSVAIPAEDSHNIGLIDNPAVRDTAGAQYITRQTSYLGQLSANWRKSQIIGALRDALYEIPDGEATAFDVAAGSGLPAKRLNQQMAAGNLTTCDMLGEGAILGGAWQTNTTDIPTELMKINRGFERLVGGYLAAVIIGSQDWAHIINNNLVAAIAGTSNPPFEMLTSEQLQLPGSRGARVQIAKLNFMPSTTWYITDQGLDMGVEGSTNFRPIVPDKSAIFVGHDPQSDVISCYVGSEPVAEYDGGPKTVKSGLNAWSTETSNPTATNLFALDNALVVNHVPNAIAYGTISG